MGLMDLATEIQLLYVHAFATWDISGTIAHLRVRTLMNVLLVPMTVCHLPDVSTRQGPIVASVLPL